MFVWKVQRFCRDQKLDKQSVLRRRFLWNYATYIFMWLLISYHDSDASLNHFSRTIKSSRTSELITKWTLSPANQNVSLEKKFDILHQTAVKLGHSYDRFLYCTVILCLVICAAGQTRMIRVSKLTYIYQEHLMCSRCGLNKVLFSIHISTLYKNLVNIFCWFRDSV